MIDFIEENAFEYAVCKILAFFVLVSERKLDNFWALI